LQGYEGFIITSIHTVLLCRRIETQKYLTVFLTVLFLKQKNLINQIRYLEA